MSVASLLASIPPGLVYLLVGLVVGVESIGVPLPGEIVLVAASLLAGAPAASVGVHGVALAAIGGAVVGDSLGYLLGHHHGAALLDRLSRRFPRHVDPDAVDYARAVFVRRGVWAVFLGRFVALLRILAGPLAGTLGMPYRRFVLANVAGAVCWAGGTAYGVYLLGTVVERWMKDFSYVALGLAVAATVVASTVLRRHLRERVAEHARRKLVDTPSTPTYG